MAPTARRKARQDARAGGRVPRRALHHVSVQDKSPRVAPDLHRRKGRRPARLRERGDPREGEGRGPRLCRSPSDDPDREPGRGDQGRAEKASASDYIREEAARFGKTWAREQAVGDEFQFPVRACFDQDVGRRGRVQKTFFGRGRGRGEHPRGSAQPLSGVAQPVAKPLRRRREATLSLGVTTGYLSVIVLIPLAALVSAPWRGRSTGLLGCDHRAAGSRCAEAHLRDLARRRADQRRRRDGDRRRSSSAIRFAGRASSTRADRPALRAADDRRRADSACAPRPAGPIGVNVAPTRRRPRPGAPVRDPAVRRPPCSGCCSNWTARWRRRPTRSARPRSRPSGGRLPRPVHRRSCPARAGIRRSLGEFGAVVLISGNQPFKTEVASVYIFGQIESDNVTGAAAVSVVLLVASLGSARDRRRSPLGHEARPRRYVLDSPRSATSPRCSSSRSGWLCSVRSRTGLQSSSRRSRRRSVARPLADDLDRVDRSASEHRLRDQRALDRPPKFRGHGLVNGIVDLRWLCRRSSSGSRWFSCMDARAGGAAG